MYITHTAHITHILHVYQVYSISLHTLHIYASIPHINNYISRTLTETSLYNDTHAHVYARLRLRASIRRGAVARCSGAPSPALLCCMCKGHRPYSLGRMRS